MSARTIPLPLVVCADGMSDEQFIKHFENRHRDQMPGVTRFVDTAKKDPRLIETYRKFHDRLHELSIVLREPHEHEQEAE